MADPKTVLEFAKKNGAKLLDLRFTDLPGLWQHVSYPINQLTEDSFEEGFGMDGSSIRGWAAINESDMLLIPDPETCVMDPFTKHPTLSLICTIQDTITRQNYSRDPRSKNYTSARFGFTSVSKGDVNPAFQRCTAAKPIIAALSVL